MAVARRAAHRAHRAAHRTPWLRLAAAIAAAIAATGCAVSASPPPASPARPKMVAPAVAGSAASSFAPIVAEVLPSVVLVRTPAGLGSGVVFDDRGHVVTNAHVVTAAENVRIQLANDPQPRAARVVGSYRPDDLAVLRVEQTKGLKPAQFADSGKIEVGDMVLAVGNPLGLSGTVTDGIISATGRSVTGPGGGGSAATTLPGAIQTSAPINPVNSGGALVNTSGQVIGIPTVAAANPASGAPAAGIGFAIPSNLARDVAGQIIEFGRVVKSHRAALGLQATTITDAGGNAAGAGVVVVSRGGPAERAALRPGDVIRALDGTATPTAASLSEAVAAKRPGQVVRVTVVRDGGPAQIAVTLGQLPGS